MIGGKWKIIIISRLIYFGQYHFSELKRSIPKINERMLTRQLREIEKDGLIFRKVYAEVPPRVEYGLSKDGETLISILHQLAEWGKLHQQ
ncbi:Transcriptional regulator, HxlR family [hydrothermal vent metagenome]|uniref:Transcriptional regulator, HxlR family n=1 Tax=hydrothermal vent metagenome TaxID=652676 RepID=A0A3B1AXD4_9ZZZZ